MAGYGYQGHIGIGIQSVFGTAVAATAYFEGLSETLTGTFDRFELKNITGENFEADDEVGIERIAGNIVVPGNPENLGFLLNGAFGTASITSLAAELAKTEFTPRTRAVGDVSSLNSLPLYTFEIFRDVTSSQQYDSCQINQIAISIQPNQEARVTADIIGRGVTNIAATTATFPGSPVKPFTFDTASLSLGGVAVDIIEALTITLNNNLEGIPSLNATKFVARIRRNSAPTVRVSGTVNFQNITEYENFRAQTEQALSINLTKASSFSLLLEVPRMVYSAFPLGIPGKDRLAVSFEGMGRFHTGSLNQYKATLTTITSEW